MCILLSVFSGVDRNFRQGARQSVAFLSINPCSAALASGLYSQNDIMYENEQLHIAGHWPQ